MYYTWYICLILTAGTAWSQQQLYRRQQLNDRYRQQTASRRIDIGEDDSTDGDLGHVEKLEYVLGILEQRGLLEQVDPQLMSQVQTFIRTAKQDENAGTRSSEPDQKFTNNRDIYSASRQRAINSRLGLVDRRAQDNQREDKRSSPRRSYWDSRRNSGERKNENSLSDAEGECQALKTENQLLKQLLQKKSSQFDNGLTGDTGALLLDALRAEDNQPITALRVLQQLQESESRISPLFEKPSPLDIVENKDNRIQPGNLIQPSLSLDDLDLEKPGGRLLRNIDHVDKPSVEIRSVLITPTPTVSTVFQTSSFETVVTENVTKEIGIHFHGRKIITSIFDTEIKTISTTETLTSTVSISPTPTWSTYTVTQTHTARNDIAPSPSKGFENLANVEEYPRNIQGSLKVPFKGIRAQVVEIPENLDSFKSLQEVLLRIKEKGEPPLPAASIVAEPSRRQTQTTSIMTVFLSGSKPGEFTTSLRTITLTQAERKKRHLVSTPSASSSVIMQTQVPELDDLKTVKEVPRDFSDFHQLASDSLIDLEGSLTSQLRSSSSLAFSTADPGISDCQQLPVTVTVTVTESLCSP